MEIIEAAGYLPADAERWRSTSALLARLRDATPRTDWLPSVPMSGDEYPDDAEKESIADILRTSHREALRERTKAIGAWYQDRPLPPLSDQARYWMLRTLDAAIEFCDRQIVARGVMPSTIVPFPKLQPVQVAVWLLTEWWSSTGIFGFLSYATSAPVLFYGARDAE